MPAFFQTKKKSTIFFHVNHWLKQLFAGRALLGPRADHTPLPCWRQPKGRNSKGSRCTWAWFLIENAGNSVFWCFSKWPFWWCLDGFFGGVDVFAVFFDGFVHGWWFLVVCLKGFWIACFHGSSMVSDGFCHSSMGVTLHPQVHSFGFDQLKQSAVRQHPYKQHVSK